MPKIWKEWHGWIQAGICPDLKDSIIYMLIYLRG